MTKFFSEDDICSENDLAIDDGLCVRTSKFAPWPSLSEEEIEAANVVLRSGRLNYWTGDEGKKFEREFAAFAGCKYAIAVANGTVALELALYALGIGKGDDVVVPSRTFVASASCAIYARSKTRVRGRRFGQSNSYGRQYPRGFVATY